MGTNNLLLKEISIDDLYNGAEATYEIPIYQRNYAWEKDEITALIQDVYDAYDKNKKIRQTYYIGTLVSFQKGDKVYEVIDGQQRLTTINLILSALRIPMKNELTYRAREKSNYTINNILSIETDEKDKKIEENKKIEKDNGIVNGYRYADKAIKEIVQKDEKEAFKEYLRKNVHLIHYQVPKNIDLNHYFEIMNSRGEQLEKHEIIKAQLFAELKKDEDKAKFNRLWEACREMKVYIQQKHPDAVKIFSNQLCKFVCNSFDDLPPVKGDEGKKTIAELIDNKGSALPEKRKQEEQIDTFQPIMDFSNFLLIVLKLTMVDEKFIKPTDIILDDKELKKEFDKAETAKLLNEDFVKRFSFNLLKAKFLLDNYIVHHSNEDDKEGNKPWKLQRWQRNDGNSYLLNLDGESEEQLKLVNLLSMFEVSFTARQRKNYLFYCLLYLFKTDSFKDGSWDVPGYCQFVSDLADKYFYDVYLLKKNLNDINTPMPGKFDEILLVGNKPDTVRHNEDLNFTGIYGDGTKESAGIPLFIFNYLDYKLWEKYFKELRGEKSNKDDPERKAFFKTLGCNDFDLKLFRQFYFSRTRRSLEHFFPQANVNIENDTPTKDQINCLGNYAMIGSEANSSGSNWDPATKLIGYLDSSNKIKKVSVASIKFMIMMQKCKDNLDNRDRKQGQEWIFEDISAHQKKMLDILGVQ